MKTSVYCSNKDDLMVHHKHYILEKRGRFRRDTRVVIQLLKCQLFKKSKKFFIEIYIIKT